MKKILLILCIAIFALGLTACGETKEPAAEPNGQSGQTEEQNEQGAQAAEPMDIQTVVNGVPLEQYLEENYPLESQEVQIFIDGESRVCVATITDPTDIQTLIDSVDFASWEKVPDEHRYEGMCYYYVHFNDDCVISLYEDIDYGKITKGTVENVYQGTDRMGDFYMAEDLLPTVKVMVEKYGTPSA